MHGNSLILKMQQRKYSKTPFLWPGLFIVALALVLFSGRKPVTATAGAAASGGSGVGTDAAASGGSGLETGVPISWMSIGQVSERLQQERRPVLIDLYTTWCGWCKEMDKKTYSNKQVAQYLQDKFYTVKVDAETHDAISWGGRTYQFNSQYRSNEFALYLTHGQLEFPTTIIIPPGGEPQAIPGYMRPKELELLVKYFGEGAYKTLGFDEFQRSFKASW
jgi:thioredoxin-related protein